MPEAELPAPRAILFDWDNTLVDTWRTIHHALGVTFEAMGETPWTLDEVRLRVRASARDAFPALFGARAEEATRIFFATYERDHLDKLAPLPGSAEMLAGLAALDLRLGVVSNKMGRLLRKEAAHLGWDRHFQGVVGANDAAADKPSAAPVKLALAGSGLELGPEIWFVGDTDIDMLCAAQAGCTRILLRPDSPAVDEFPGHEPQVYLPACSDLSDLVVEKLRL
ncbi:MAG: HAD family hydrolase [Rhodovibrionaceae bacterium]